jgi:hypothetical protein
VSLARFQSLLMRLVVDTAFRDAARADPGVVLNDSGLTPLEQRRLMHAALSDGLGVTVMLHRGWRLGKLLSLMPGTCALLGPDRVATELGMFWRERLPDSLYFRDEALAFADHLERRGLSVSIPGLDRMMTEERGRIGHGAPSSAIAGAH